MKNKGKQDRSRKTISTILQAATQVIVDEGYDGATTNRIAERAGFSIGTLYQYFEDKHDVYRELVIRVLTEIEMAMAACEPGDTLSDTLHSTLRSVLMVVSGQKGQIQALSPLMVSRFRELLDESRENVVASMYALLDAHREEIVVEDVEFAARIVVNACEGFALSSYPTLFPSPAFLAHMHRLGLAYLTAPNLPSPITRSLGNLPPGLKTI